MECCIALRYIITLLELYTFSELLNIEFWSYTDLGAIINVVSSGEAQVTDVPLWWLLTFWRFAAALFLLPGIRPRCSQGLRKYPTRCLVLVRTGKHKAVRTQVLASFRLMVLYRSVGHGRVVHGRVGYGRVVHGGVVHGGVGIGAACNKTVVVLMNSRLVSKRNCVITRETKIAAILARSRFIEQARSIVLLRINWYSIWLQT